jgi:lactose/L-arabinose transport system substrate-binding protein
MPWDSAPVGMFYRVDYFQKAGVDPNSIQTWDDYIAAGVKIQAANPGVKMAALDFTKDDGLFRMLLQQQGAYYFTSDGKININSPEAVKAMTIIENANKAGLFANAEGWDGAVASMKNGKEATRAFGVWWSGTIEDSAPDAKGKWDVFPMPAIDKGGSHATNLGGSTLAIAANTKSPDAAWAYVEYATATAEAQNTMFKKYGIFPSFIPAYQDPFYTQPDAFFNGKPVWQVFTKIVPDIKPVIYTNDNDKALVVGANAQGAILGGADIKQTLDKAASDLKNQTKRQLAIGA